MVCWAQLVFDARVTLCMVKRIAEDLRQVRVFRHVRLMLHSAALG
jgi:hypothetical protein